MAEPIAQDFAAPADRLRSARKVMAVARHEFIGMVTRAGYLIALLVTPLFLAGFPLVSAVMTSRLVFGQLAETRAVGLVDESGLFAHAPAWVATDGGGTVPREIAPRRTAAAAPRKLELRRFASLPEARRALLAGEVALVLRIPAGYLATGRVEELRKARRGLDLVQGRLVSARSMEGWFVGALAGDRVDPAVAARLVRPVLPAAYLVEADGRVTEEDPLRELGALAVPVGFSLLLMLSIFTSGSYLATGLSEEKQNRALEMMLTSLTAEQLFWGKLLGLGLAALVQFLFYQVLVAAPAALVFAALGLQLGQLVASFAYFVLGFFFYGALLLTVGSVGNTQRYTQQLSGLVGVVAMAPFLALPVLLGEPQGTLARVLTYVPFTAPIAGMLRAGAGALPPWELALSLLSLAVGTAAMVRGCAKIFRVALLSSGTSPGLPQLWSWLRD
jgi:ABC-2 type transport system permease protein